MPIDNGGRRRGGSGDVVVPAPDPTALTTEALTRGLQELEKLFGSRFDHIDHITEQRRLESQGIIDAVRREIEHLKEFHAERFHLQEEKFLSIGMRFDERDVRTAQAAETSQKALDAALLAAAALVRQQNEANAAAAEKVELSFTKQLDQVVQQIQSEGKAKDLRISEIKERLDRGDGSSVGSTTAKDDRHSDVVRLMAGIGLLLSAMAIIATIIIASLR